MFLIRLAYKKSIPGFPTTVQNVTQDHFSLSLVEILKMSLQEITFCTKLWPLFSGFYPCPERYFFHCGKICELCRDEEPTDGQGVPKLCILDSRSVVVEQPQVQPQLSQAASPSQTLSQNIPDPTGIFIPALKWKAECWIWEPAVLHPKEAATCPAQPRNCSSALCVQ